MSFQVHKNMQGEASGAGVDPQLVQMLSGLDAQANMAVVQRTRRAVMEAAHEMRASQSRSRRQLGVILLALVSLVILLTPAIWIVVDDLFSDEHFQDAPTMTMSLVVTVFSAIFAALLVTWRTRQSRNREEI